MKIATLFALILTCIQSAYTQEGSKKILTGIFLTPQVGMLASSSEDLWDSEPAFSSQAGLRIGIPTATKLTIQSGITVQKATLNQRDYSPNFPADFQNGEVLVKLSYFKFQYDYVAIGIPLGLELAMSNRPNHMYVEGNINGRYLVDHEVKHQLIESGMFTHDLDVDSFGIEMRNFHFLLDFGVGYRFKLNEKRSLSFGAAFEYSLSNILQDRPIFLSHQFVGGHPMFVGIRIRYL